MKLITYLLSTTIKKDSIKQSERSTFEVKQQELLSRQGREQFEKLVDRGLGIPVAIF